MRSINICLLLMLSTLSVLLTTKADAQETEFLDHAILVNVNDIKITRSQLDKMGLMLFKMNYPNRDENTINESELEELSANALKELIIICLTEDEADIRNSDEDTLNDLTVSSEDIDRQLQALGLKSFSTSPLAQRFAKSKTLRSKIIYGAKSGMNPSPRDVKIFYLKNRNTVFTEQRLIRIRELFLSSDSLNASITKKQAQMLYNTLKKSSIKKRFQLFPQMATEFSQDKFKKDGGLIVTGTPGNFIPQDSDFIRSDGSTAFPKEMIQTIHDLSAAGDIMLTKSSKGWHIIMLEAVKGGKKVPINKCRGIIEGYLEDQNFEEAYNEWLVEKVKDSRIMWNDGDPFPTEKITDKLSKEESLRYLRAQFQYYIEMSKNKKRRQEIWNTPLLYTPTQKTQKETLKRQCVRTAHINLQLAQ
eukprot:TRINITY_DN34984_c0_g1_i1.p1 TRINITY_DN34984_c0_g1~~TRINITY_DN34984_c0_g1_i1.p1  ORF type:complete len:418 (-),score=51.20 TRINITY_DN34984_c0_g1_i1:209-1462(-)